MMNWKIVLYEVDVDAPTSKTRKVSAVSVQAKNVDHALREARNYLRKRGKIVRSVNATTNRNELVAYVFNRAPADREART